MHISTPRSASRNAGGALLPVLIVVTTLAGVAAALFATSVAHNREVTAAGMRARAIYLAEAAVSQAVAGIAGAIETGSAVPTTYGTSGAPISVTGGRFWADILANADGTYTVTATGRAGLTPRRIVAVVSPADEGVFDHAIFAGNSSGDPGYMLELSGSGSDADQIMGNVFANGDVEVNDDASVSGDVLAAGAITGVTGTSGVSLPIPDIPGMDYESNHDVDVAALFAAGGTSQGNSLGGTALELPESSPAHIFRLNPSDRTTETSGTAKDDYFLEDPYMPVTDFTAAFNGKSGHSISLSGAPGKPGADGNQSVYYIDGNLWIHNKPFGRLRFLTQGGGTGITFVVKGNIYVCDDVLLEDESNDALAFIAIEDDAEPDSGNIYFGDPRYGTLERMFAYMYAENDFYDNNLDASGSATVDLFGNMTAGNQVDIQRDFVTASGVVHSKLMVDFDERLSTSSISLPGLPQADDGVSGLRVVFWKEVDPY